MKEDGIDARFGGIMDAMNALTEMAEKGNALRLEMIKGICKKHSVPHVYEEILFMWSYHSPEDRAAEDGFLRNVNARLSGLT